MEVDRKDYEIIVEEDWVGIRVRDNLLVTADLIIQILKELYSMEAYRTDKSAGLWDFRGCMTDIKYESMMKIKEFIDYSYDNNWSHSITAFVVDHDLLYGLSRMYEIISDEIPTTLRIFRNMDEAQNWLRGEILQKKNG